MTGAEAARDKRAMFPYGLNIAAESVAVGPWQAKAPAPPTAASQEPAAKTAGAPRVGEDWCEDGWCR